MRVVIAGGGNVGTFIASELVHAGHEVTVVEIDPDRVRQAEKTNEPAGVAWLNADACEVTEFARAEVDRADVVAAVTGDDEDNLVISLLAKQEFAVPRVVALQRLGVSQLPPPNLAVQEGDVLFLAVVGDRIDDIDGHLATNGAHS